MPAKAAPKTTTKQSRMTKPKAAKPKGERVTVKGHALTKGWPSKNGKEIAKGDKVKHTSGVAGLADWRFTRDKDGKRVPYIGILVDGTATVGGRKTRHASFPANEITHVGAQAKPKAKAKAKGKVPESAEVQAEAASRLPDAERTATVMQRAMAAADRDAADVGKTLGEVTKV